MFISFFTHRVNMFVLRCGWSNVCLHNLSLLQCIKKYQEKNKQVPRIVPCTHA